MTEQTPSQAAQAEALSALLDNEASELELMRLLKTVDGIDEGVQLRQTWSRYQLASAGLRHDLPSLAPSDFAARISAALADEPAHSAAAVSGKPAHTGHWWQQLGKMAVAASVASALVVGVQEYQQLQVPEASLAANAPAAAVPQAPVSPNLPSGINAPALSARTVAVQSGYEHRPQESRRVLFVPRQEAAPVYNEDVSSYVNQLIEEHSGNASLNAGQGMLPFTRVILTDEE